MERLKSGSKPAGILQIDGIDYRIRYDVQQDENEDYTYLETSVNHYPTLAEVKEIVKSYYNSLCDTEILSGYTYDGHTVWLSSENQFNYKAAFDFQVQIVGAGGTYTAQTFKFGDEENAVYQTFETLADLQAFITEVFTYINTTLNKYWQIKDAIDWSYYETE